MPTYRVRYNTRLFQPAWGAKLRRVFGEKNQGVDIEAPTEEAAILEVATRERINAGHLTTATNL